MSKRRGGTKGSRPARAERPADAVPAPSEALPVAPGPLGWRTQWPEWVCAALLAGVVLLRPFWDGVTFEYGNIPYVWAILAAFSFWGVRALLRGGSIRHGNLLLLLGGFVLVAALTGRGTVSPDNTHRALVLWAAYFFLFATAANALRSGFAIALVLGAFVVASFGEAILSFVHYYFLLPAIRRQLIADPRQLAVQFGTPILTPELAHRLNMNRAFGSFLFANALAAFLVLGIPYFIGEAANSFRRYRDGVRTAGRRVWSEEEDVRRRVSAAGVALVCFIVSFETARWWYLRAQGMTYGAQPWNAFPIRAVFFLGVLPLAVSAVPAVFIWRRGLALGWWGVQAMYLPVVALVTLEALRLTFSRGGFLALAVAAVLGAALVWHTGRRSDRRKEPANGRRVTGAMAGLLLGAALFAAFDGPALAQPPPQPPAGAQPVAQTAPLADPASTLVVEGVDYTAQDLANPATLRMRLQYWRIAARIIADNFWTGVGLMGFQSVYPQYQDLRATPVKAAHNDFLQVFAETGLPGFLLFTAFWGYFLYWGFRRICAQDYPGERWALIGLYTGVLAFLLHSVLDFNFYNPSLAMLQFALAGVFVARAAADTPVRGRRQAHAFALVGLLVAAALVAGAGARVYRAKALTGEERELNVGLQVARTLASLDATPQRLETSHSEPYSTLSVLIPAREEIESFGAILLPPQGAGQGYRRIESGAAAGRDELAGAMVSVRNPAVARAKVIEHAQRRVRELERAHRIYPHDPDTAVNLVQWNNFLRETAVDAASRRTHTLAMLRWAEEAVKRDARVALLRGVLGDALLRRAEIETDARRQRDFTDRALGEFKEATRLAPTSPEVWEEYSRRAFQYAGSLQAVGAADEAARMQTEGQRAADRAQEIRRSTV